MWFKLASADTLINEQNIIRIRAGFDEKKKVGVWSDQVDDSVTKLATFDTAEQARTFITLLKQEMTKNQGVIDLSALINIAMLCQERK